MWRGDERLNELDRLSSPVGESPRKDVTMADPADLLRAWQNAIRDIGGTAASLAAGSAGVAGELLRPLQHQGELLQRVLQRQLEFDRELVSRAGAPLRASLDLVDQATGTFHEQATSFRAASKSFGQLAVLMEQQARLLERASAAIRDPAAVFRATGEDTLDSKHRPAGR